MSLCVMQLLLSVSKLYTKDGVFVKISNGFVYSEEIYKRTPTSFMLIRRQLYTSSQPIIRSKDEIANEDYRYNPESKVAVIRYWELEEAPEEYLIKNNYKLV